MHLILIINLLIGLITFGNVTLLDIDDSYLYNNNAPIEELNNHTLNEVFEVGNVWSQDVIIYGNNFDNYLLNDKFGISSIINDKWYARTNYITNYILTSFLTLQIGEGFESLDIVQEDVTNQNYNIISGQAVIISDINDGYIRTVLQANQPLSITDYYETKDTYFINQTFFGISSNR